jgi:protein involved in sex pheromone biosynthesis
MKKTIVIIFLVAIMLMILGCEPKSKGSWIRPTNTEAEFQKNREECVNQARKETKENFDLLFSKCMQSKGYLWREEGYTWQDDPWALF